MELMLELECTGDVELAYVCPYIDGPFVMHQLFGLLKQNILDTVVHV